MASRWIRLNTDWSASDWIAEMKPASRLAWVELLCYVKAHGTAGVVKRVSPTVAARVTGVTRNEFDVMEKAAIADGALRIEGGDWIITGWGEHQMDVTAKDRQRRYRERQQGDRPAEAESGVTDVTGVTRNGRHVTPTETETKELPPIIPQRKASQLSEAWKPTDSHARKAEQEGVSLEREEAKFRNFHLSKASRFVDWDRAFHGWLLKAGEFSAGKPAHEKPKRQHMTPAEVRQHFGAPEA